MYKLWLTTILIACPGLPALAQTVSGTIIGVVTDPSGLAIAGATVALRSEETGAVQQQTTGPTGGFVFTAVLPGPSAMISPAWQWLLRSEFPTTGSRTSSARTWCRS